MVVATHDVPRLETRGLTKRFGSVLANDRLSLRVRCGEIVVLLGENGAGKTTLLQCLAGMLEPDSGEIAVDGQPLRLSAPADALRAGIGTVYQHFALVPTFTVEEQLRLAGWRPGMANGPEEIGVDPVATIEALSLGARQRVEIARAMVAAGRVLLLDEPTSVLAPPEVDTLFTLLRSLRERGVSVVLVTHKLREALAVGDRIIVLRHGKVAGERARTGGAWPTATEAELFGLMFDIEVGSSVGTEGSGTSTRSTLSPLLRVDGLTTPGSALATPLHDVSFVLRPSEIVAVVGVDGNGQRELAETLAGFRAPTRGTIAICGREVAGVGPARARQAGIGYLTADRLGEGTVASRSLVENLALTRLDERGFTRFGLLNRAEMRRDAVRRISAFDVRPSDPDAPLGTLSGGNIQKLLLARAVAAAPRVLICHEATSGLDARTARIVRGRLRAFANEGRAVLFLTNELEEAVTIGDRVGAIARGRLSTLAPPADVSASALGRFMVGAG